MAFSFMNYVNRVGLAVAREPIQEKYGISETEFGTIISSLLLAYTICMVPGGWFSDRFGGWLALAAMGLGTAAFCGATGILGWTISASMGTSMVALLWVVRASMGVFTAPLYPAAGRIVSQWVPFPQRARANALVTGVAMLGIAVNYPLVGALVDTVGWPATFMILALVTAALAIVWICYARDEPGDHPAVTSHELAVIGADARNVVTTRHEKSLAEVALDTRYDTETQRRNHWSSVVRNRSLWLLTASYAAVGYVEYLIFYWSEHYFKNVLQFGKHEGRIAAMIPPLGMAVFLPLGGWLCDALLPIVGYRRCRAWVALGGMIGCCAMLMLATLVHSSVGVVACFALSLAFIALTEAPAWATAIDLGGRQAATSAAIANTGGNAGGTLSPTVTPWVSALLVSHYGVTTQEGWVWGIRFAGLVCFVGAVLWFWIDASERYEER
jgi:ACS family glucarate transporter-like MFS transporter